ncbi:hypothetical protein IFM89_009126 [Coptis chinensis]|uniref:DUF629 domain-containing protein n=1 Tax=Coptis chinensis TaxID=261450 RepID=A0A835LRD6_9MAGN|nr:hypothetical protein IFM89_009126 [Coptis chinensis]
MAIKKHPKPPLPMADQQYPEFESIKMETKKLIASEATNNFFVTLKYIEQGFGSQMNTAYHHRLQAAFYDILASKATTQAMKGLCLGKGVHSARRSIELAPESIEFAYFHAYMLYRRAYKAKCYNEALQECNRALAIPNPSDPEEDWLAKDDEQEVTEQTEERIGKVKDLLHLLIIDCNKEKFIRRWNTLDADEKNSFIELSVENIKSYFSSLGNELANKVITDALSYIRDHYQDSKYWLCCFCDKRFDGFGEHSEHVLTDHPLSPTHRSLCSSLEVDCSWTEIIEKGKWKPVDTSAAIKRLESEWKVQDSRSESSRLVEDDPKKWPESDDYARTKNLKSIHNKLRNLLHNKALLAVHVNKVTQYAMNKLHGLLRGSPLLELGLDQTHLCICLLEASQLDEILKYLEQITKFYSHISKGKNKASIPKPKYPVGIEVYDDTLYVLFPEESLSLHGGSAPTGDAFSTWIFSGISSEDSLEKWTSVRNERKSYWEEVLGKIRTFLRQKNEELSKIQSDNTCKDILSEDVTQQRTLPMVPTDVSDMEIVREADSGLMLKPQVDNHDNHDLKFREDDAWFMQFSEYNRDWEHNLKSHAESDYKEIMYPLVKSYIRIFSLWVVSPRKLGGLDEVGNVLSVSGSFLVILAKFLAQFQSM